jgi:hypothetical protein
MSLPTNAKALLVSPPALEDTYCNLERPIALRYLLNTVITSFDMTDNITFRRINW